MPHEITIRPGGFAEATFHELPGWHDLAGLKGELVVKGRKMLSDDVRKVMDFGPKREILYRRDEESGSFHEYPLVVGIVRSDNGFPLGYVSPNYAPYGQLEALELTDSLMMDGLMEYESGFTLQGGKNVVILAKMPGVHEVAEGDCTLPYLMVVINHTGQHRVRFLPTSVRVVCANTMMMALAQGKGQIFSVRHSGDMELKMDQVRNALSEIHSSFTDHTKVARKLAAKPVTNATWRPYLDKLFPVPFITDPEFTQRKHDAVRKIRRQVTFNLVDDPAQQIPSTQGSWYAAFNAVTQWVDHREYKGGSPEAKAETRFTVSNFGSGNDLKVKAWNSAVQMSSN